MYSPKALEEIISRFIEIVNIDFPLEAVYLFGSYAAGTAKNYSDIDLAVISNNFSGNRFEDALKLTKYVLATSADIEVHPFKTTNFNPETDILVESILKTGKRVYAANN